MDTQPTRRILTLLLVLGAVTFGMVLAGGLDMTPAGHSEPAPQPLVPAEDEAATPLIGLPDFADLVDRVSPAVVSIEAISFEPSRRRADPFEFFFGPRRRDTPDPRQEEFRSESGGSGFVISEDGLIVTNHHVVREADELKVHRGSEVFDAEVKGVDPATDLALLEIDVAGSLPYLALGDSDRLRVGEWVMAVGSPLGLDDTVTVGVVSAKGRQIFISSDTSFENFIQTDAAINFGNSGGPLLNLRGEVIGINTAINFGSENIGFAVPVNMLKQILPQLRETGRVSRGFLGIGVNNVDQKAAEAFGMDEAKAVYVVNVTPGLPADKAGVKHGDVILEVDGREIDDTRTLIDYVSAREPGSKVNLRILRDGETLDLEVELAERPSGEEAEEAEDEPEEGGIEWMGLRYQDMTPGLRSMHSLPDDLKGVWITSISPRSPLNEEGLQVGNLINVITEVNGRAVSSVEEFEELVRAAEPGSRLRLYIRRFAGGGERPPLYVFPAVPRSR